MRLTVYLVLLAITGCRGEQQLYCRQLDGTFFNNDDCDVVWSACSDGVVREIRCVYADPRYECQCYEDDVTNEAIQISDDMCDTVEGQDRDAVRAATNAMCHFGLVEAEEFTR